METGKPMACHLQAQNRKSWRCSSKGRGPRVTGPAGVSPGVQRPVNREHPCSRAQPEMFHHPSQLPLAKLAYKTNHPMTPIHLAFTEGLSIPGSSKMEMEKRASFFLSLYKQAEGLQDRNREKWSGAKGRGGTDYGMCVHVRVVHGHACARASVLIQTLQKQ